VSVFVEEHRARFGVEPICRELEVSARAYRQRRAAPPSRRAQSDAVLLAEIRRIHSETDESYGAWRCWRQLRKDGRTHRSLGGQTPQEVTDQYHRNHGTDTQKTT
jgi:hypothetical protein